MCVLMNSGAHTQLWAGKYTLHKFIHAHAHAHLHMPHCRRVSECPLPPNLPCLSLSFPPPPLSLSINLFIYLSRSLFAILANAPYSRYARFDPRLLQYRSHQRRLFCITSLVRGVPCTFKSQTALCISLGCLRPTDFYIRAFKHTCVRMHLLSWRRKTFFFPPP